MKKIIAILLAMLLPVCAGAETIAQQIGAPEHIIGEFCSSSGRTTVYVDADIFIPAVENLHRYEVRSRLFSVEEIHQVADLYIGQGQWICENTESEELCFVNKQTSKLYCHCQVYSLDRQAYLDALYSVVNIMGHDYHHVNALWAENRTGNTSRQIGTAEDARLQAEGYINALWPEMEFSSIDPSQSNLSSRSGDQYGYRVYFCRTLDGVPVTPVYMSGAGDSFNNVAYTPPLPYEKLFVDVGADGVFCIRYEYPLEIVGQLETNISILSFEQIWDIFSTVSPLTIAYLESNDNNGLCIDQIALGYMCVQMKDDPSRYQLIPVWDFFGSRTIGNDTFEEYNYPYITINAIDGTVIDRSYGY